MTYHAGIGLGMATLGLRPRDPQVTCDGPGCNAWESAVRADGGPRAWLLKRRSPPGWLMIRREEPFYRKDYCPSCRSAAEHPNPGERDG